MGTRTTSTPGTWKYWQGVPIVSHDYDIDQQVHNLQLENGDLVKVSHTWVLGEGQIGEAPTRTHGVTRKEVEDLEERYKKIVNDITEAFKKREEEHERKRTQDKERIKHLQDQVSDLQRELQRWYEPNSRMLSVGSIGEYVNTSSTSVLDLSRVTVGSTIPTSGSYSSGNWSTTSDDTI